MDSASVRTGAPSATGPPAPPGWGYTAPRMSQRGATSDAASEPVIFGKYELIDRIAVGGMAEIFLSRSASIGGVVRTCVIKRILPEYSADRQFVSMFIDEARITIGLDHANIVRLFDFGQVAGTYYMAMEYVDGFDLVDVLRLHKRTGPPMPAPAAAYVARCMCAGLHHAHVQKDHRGLPLGIVHRDVSPHNVFVSTHGEVKIGDFGIASARNKLTVTQAGTLKGKFAYMAPEQTTGSVIDHRADVWATGVTLYEMLTGARLFASENPVATIARVTTAEVKPPSLKQPSVSSELDDIVLTSLERDLDKRYNSADMMRLELDRYLGKEGYGQKQFADYLSRLEWTDDTAPSRRAPVREATTNPFAPVPSIIQRTPAVSTDEKVKALVEKLRKEPDLWTLVAIGERHAELENKRAALSALRTAAAVFANKGLLVQGICALKCARRLLSENELKADYQALAKLRGHDRDDLMAYLQEADTDGFWGLLQAVDREGGLDEDDVTNVLHPAPLFGRLPPDDFVRLVMATKTRLVAVGERIVEEGEAGNALYAVGHGKVVVRCRPGSRDGTFPASDDDGDEDTEGGALRPEDLEAMPTGNFNKDTFQDVLGPDQDRIYLSALADGDFFGEFSFLTGRPRSATVESITDVLLLEIDQQAADNILRNDPAFKQPLLDFYKERVGELMMAKNPVFAVLSQQDRRELLMRSKLRRYSDQGIVVGQGDISEEMYFIKHGEVEVYRDEQGLPVFINKLREGEFFGEMAAVHGTPRSANVRAMGDVELFCMDKSDLDEILAREPKVRELFAQAIQWRAEEATQRLAETRRIFEGV